MLNIFGGMFVLCIRWFSLLVVSGDSLDIFSIVVLFSVRYGVVF